MARGDTISQQTEDAVVALIMQRVAERGHYGALMESMTDEARVLVEECVERHAARMRADGQPGW